MADAAVPAATAVPAAATDPEPPTAAATGAAVPSDAGRVASEATAGAVASGGQVCVLGLPGAWTAADLLSLLASKALAHKGATKPAGRDFGFVTFAYPADRAAAQAALEGFDVNGRSLSLREARRKLDRPEQAAAASKKAGKRKTHLCLDFVRGACEYGEGCRFSHDADTPLGPVASKQRGEDATATAGPSSAAALAEAAGPRDVRDVTSPLWRLPYGTQLEQKRQQLATILKRLRRQAAKEAAYAHTAPPTWAEPRRFPHGLACPLEGVVRSPSVCGYRNKCDFTCGLSADGSPEVGFQMGAFKAGHTAVGRVDDCPHVSATAKAYAAAAGVFLRRSSLPVWDKRSNSGCWRTLLVREAGCTAPLAGDWQQYFRPSPVGGPATQAVEAADVPKAEAPAAVAAATASLPYASDSAAETEPPPAAGAQALVMLQLNPQAASADVLQAELAAFVAAMDAVAAERHLPLNMLLIQHHSGVSNVAPADAPILSARAAAGAGTEEPSSAVDVPLVESLLGLRFRVSATSFFQVNTAAAEVLYSLVGAWAAPAPGALLLDICCGTGTIGLTLASRVARVVGIDLVPSAIEDARANAALNAITNAEYVCGKAEAVLASVLRKHGVLPEGAAAASAGGTQYSDVVAIVDPPRAGLHPTVVRLLRHAPAAVRRLVYVSCNPDSMAANVADLVRPEYGHGHGGGGAAVGGAAPPPWRPVRAMAVDQFPHTEHSEAVMLFERGEA